MARIVVSGYMVRHPVAGNLLAFFHYVLGLWRLGHEVVYLEESGWPYSCYDPETRRWVDHPEGGLRVVGELLSSHGASVPLVYVNRETGRISGGGSEDVARLLSEADLLLNIGGVCWLPEFLLCGRRALIDMDPLFTQVERFGAKALGDYHVHFSYGANLGRPGCTVPTLGIDWRPAVPPVVADLWEGAEPPADGRFTTIGNWGSYGGVTYEGEYYGQKDEEFLRLIDLPLRTPARLELALSGGQEVAPRFRAKGWSIRDAGEEVSGDVATYRDYILSSRGEFSVAKNAYVRTRSGWFSDRSVCYLAAGLPAVLQDTGFSDWLPTGRGVIAFRTADEAAALLGEVEADYPGHRRAAREVAREFFDHRVVLPKLLESAFERTSSPPGVRGALP
jgi:hypothetical protein